MQIKRFNVTIPQEYEKNGEKKTKWNNVGTLTEFHKETGVSRILEIPAIGMEAQVFEWKDRDEKAAPKTEPSVKYDEKNADNIPF